MTRQTMTNLTGNLLSRLPYPMTLREIGALHDLSVPTVRKIIAGDNEAGKTKGITHRERQWIRRRAAIPSTEAQIAAIFGISRTYARTLIATARAE